MREGDIGSRAAGQWKRRLGAELELSPETQLHLGLRVLPSLTGGRFGRDAGPFPTRRQSPQIQVVRRGPAFIAGCDVLQIKWDTCTIDDQLTHFDRCQSN